MTCSDWRPTASLDALRRRALLLRRIRGFFDSLGFIEVQTPVLSRDTVVDAHLDPIAVPAAAVNVAPQNRGDESAAAPPWYLQTSPEFLMKRLVAAGATAIYQIGPVFRAGEAGQMHNPEFTMAEWYRQGDTLADGVGLLSDLSQAVLSRNRATVRRYGELFESILGIDPIQCPLDHLRQSAASIGEADFARRATHRDELLDLLFSQRIQPELGKSEPLIVTHYPASQAALARLSDNDPRLAERFELFCDGIELANGYAEMMDAETIRERFSAANQLRQQRGAAPLPADSRMIEAIRQPLPPISGCALGVDRLQMVLDRAASIRDVIPFPADRA